MTGTLISITVENPKFTETRKRTELRECSVRYKWAIYTALQEDIAETR